MPHPIIVICTAPNSSSAPAAAPIRTYANENGAAYANSATGPTRPAPAAAADGRRSPPWTRTIAASTQRARERAARS